MLTTSLYILKNNKMPKTFPQANLHTPEELLESANELFLTQNPKMMRAATLEAITALEAYVQAKIFPALSAKFGGRFSEWLENKTRMDFDSRLEIITPIAIDLPVNTDTNLWSDYKKARKIRHSIIHNGKKVSQGEAKFVIDTVYKWIAYLSSTVGLELALRELKAYIEHNHIQINREDVAISIIADYFAKFSIANNIEKDAAIIPNDSGSLIPIDLVLQIGPQQIVVETKFSRNLSIRSLVKRGVEQVLYYAKHVGVTQAALIIFEKGEIESEFNKVLKFEDGRVYVVVIQV